MSCQTSLYQEEINIDAYEAGSVHGNLIFTGILYLQFFFVTGVFIGGVLYYRKNQPTRQNFSTFPSVNRY